MGLKGNKTQKVTGKRLRDPRKSNQLLEGSGLPFWEVYHKRDMDSRTSDIEVYVINKRQKIK